MAETKVSPRAAGRSPATLVAASGPLLVRVTVKVIVSPTLGVGSLTVLASARSACCGVTVRRGRVVGGVGVELVGVADGRGVGLRVGAGDEWPRSISVCRVAGGRRVPTVQSPVVGS